MGQKTDSHHGKDHLFGGADPIPGLATATGWTALFGDRFEPVVTGVDTIQWQVPRQIVGSTGSPPWFIFDPEAGLYTPSSSGNVEIMLGARLADGVGGYSAFDLLDSPIVIEAGELSSRSAASQPVVSQNGDLVNYDSLPAYGFIMISVQSAGTDATGLSVNVPIGIERVSGSGYH